MDSYKLKIYTPFDTVRRTMGRVNKSKVHPHALISSDHDLLHRGHSDDPSQEVTQRKFLRQDSKALFRAQERLRQKGLGVRSDDFSFTRNFAGVHKAGGLCKHMNPVVH